MDSDDDMIVALAVVAANLNGVSEQRSRRRRKTWAAPWLLRRPQYGAYETLLREPCNRPLAYEYTVHYRILYYTDARFTTAELVRFNRQCILLTYIVCVRVIEGIHDGWVLLPTRGKHRGGRHSRNDVWNTTKVMSTKVISICTHFRKGIAAIPILQLHLKQNERSLNQSKMCKYKLFMKWKHLLWTNRHC